MAEQNKRGGISVEAEHIFPIIKKWLYSDKEIFLREIVSNAVDAATKIKRLVSLGEIKDIDTADLKVTVSLDSELGTITVSDNGIGMTEDELIKYLGSIALSGALDFIKEYEGEGENGKNGIIGHFGLGFYSAFMVSDKVEVETRSYKGDKAVRWVCDASGSYELFDSDREERGTSITMYIGEEGKEYLNENTLRAILTKYCSFVPVPLYFEGACEHKDGECECDKPINDVSPLWQRSASECTDEQYAEFYRKVFSDYREPLLTIHINADYPLNFKGILYFPRRQNEFESPEGQIKLYYNQMFVADNIREVIPEHLLMLRGVLDCPELPLNVSRSYLQNNTYVKKIAAHITKKVADKLVYMKENERERYESIWADIKPFAEYSAICDAKFYDRAGEAMLFRCVGGTYKTLEEYLECAKEKHENTVYYTVDEQSQAQFISLYRKKGIEVAVLEGFIDTQYIQMLEDKKDGVKFFRVDANTDALKSDGEEGDAPEALSALFKKVSGKETLSVRKNNLTDGDIPAILNVSEQSRRMEDMMRVYAAVNGGEERPSFAEETLYLNMANELVGTLAEKTEFDSGDELVARQIYMLSVLSQRKLSASELEAFLSDSYKLLGIIK